MLVIIKVSQAIGSDFVDVKAIQGSAMPPNENDKLDQADKFAKSARELGADEDETRFNEALKKVAQHKPAPAPPKPAQKSKPKKPGQ